MFGFHDHVINPRSGRPESHPSWVGEVFHTWLTWTMAILFIVFSVFYYIEWNGFLFSFCIAAFGVFLIFFGFYRHFALNKKKADLCKAEVAYESSLARAFESFN